MQEQYQDALKEHEGVVRDTAQSYEEYINELDRAAESAGYMIDEEGNLVQKHEAMGAVNYELIKSNYALTQSEYDLKDSLKETAKGFAKARDAAFDARKGLTSYGWSMEELATLMQGEMGKEMKDFSDGTVRSQ